MLLAFCCSFANAGANTACGVDVSGHTDWVWRPASDIAIKLPADSSPAYGEGPGHGSVLWKVPAGTAVARYGVAPVDWWADEVKKICSATIDGYRAEIFRIVHSGNDELAAVFRRGALGPDLTITLPLASRRNVATELAELLSVVFINDPARLRVVSVDATASEPSAVFVNEIGIESEFKLGDYVSDRAGSVWQIGDNLVVTKTTHGAGKPSGRILHWFPVRP